MRCRQAPLLLGYVAACIETPGESHWDPGAGGTVGGKVAVLGRSNHCPRRLLGH